MKNQKADALTMLGLGTAFFSVFFSNTGPFYAWHISELAGSQTSLPTLALAFAGMFLMMTTLWVEGRNKG